MCVCHLLLYVCVRVFAFKSFLRKTLTNIVHLECFINIVCVIKSYSNKRAENNEKRIHLYWKRTTSFWYARLMSLWTFYATRSQLLCTRYWTLDIEFQVNSHFFRSITEFLNLVFSENIHSSVCLLLEICAAGNE